MPSPAGDDVVVGIALGGDDATCPQSLTTVSWGSAIGGLAQTSTAGALNDSATWPGSGFKLLSCAAGNPVLAGGPSGIGELDQEGPGLARGSQLALVYRRFDVANHAFGAPVEVSDETTVSSGGASSVSLFAGLDRCHLRRVGGQPGPGRKLELRRRRALVRAGGDGLRPQRHRGRLRGPGIGRGQVRGCLQQARCPIHHAPVPHDAQLQHPHEAIEPSPAWLPS